jgi:serine/threonine-protein kinase RIO1
MRGGSSGDLLPASSSREEEEESWMPQAPATTTSSYSYRASTGSNNGSSRNNQNIHAQPPIPYHHHHQQIIRPETTRPTTPSSSVMMSTTMKLQQRRQYSNRSLGNNSSPAFTPAPAPNAPGNNSKDDIQQHGTDRNKHTSDYYLNTSPTTTTGSDRKNGMPNQIDPRKDNVTANTAVDDLEGSLSANMEEIDEMEKVARAQEEELILMALERSMTETSLERDFFTPDDHPVETTAQAETIPSRRFTHYQNHHPFHQSDSRLFANRRMQNAYMDEYETTTGGAPVRDWDQQVRNGTISHPPNYQQPLFHESDSSRLLFRQSSRSSSCTTDSEVELSEGLHRCRSWEDVKPKNETTTGEERIRSGGRRPPLIRSHSSDDSNLFLQPDVTRPPKSRDNRHMGGNEHRRCLSGDDNWFDSVPLSHQSNLQKSSSYRTLRDTRSTDRAKLRTTCTLPNQRLSYRRSPITTRSVTSNEPPDVTNSSNNSSRRRLESTDRPGAVAMTSTEDRATAKTPEERAAIEAFILGGSSPSNEKTDQDIPSSLSMSFDSTPMQDGYHKTQNRFEICNPQYPRKSNSEENLADAVNRLSNPGQHVTNKRGDQTKRSAWGQTMSARGSDKSQTVIASQQIELQSWPTPSELQRKSNSNVQTSASVFGGDIGSDEHLSEEEMRMIKEALRASEEETTAARNVLSNYDFSGSDAHLTHEELMDIQNALQGDPLSENNSHLSTTSAVNIAAPVSQEDFEAIERAIREVETNEEIAQALLAADAEEERKSLALALRMQQEENEYQRLMQRGSNYSTSRQTQGNVRTITRQELQIQELNRQMNASHGVTDSFNDEGDFDCLEVTAAGFRMNTSAAQQWTRRDQNTVVGPNQETRTKHDLDLHAQANAHRLGLEVDDSLCIGNQAYNSFLQSMKDTKKGVSIKGTGRAGSDADATKGKSLDPKVRSQIMHAINNSIIEKCNGVIKEGKEAIVYHADKGTESDGFDVAIKVFKRISEFKGRGDYVDGDPRHRSSFRDSGSRQRLEIWAEKEFRNLIRAHRSGVPVPRPLLCKENVLFMRFLGFEGWPAPQLREISLKRGSSRWTTLYEQVIEALKRYLRFVSFGFVAAIYSFFF